MLRNHRGEFEHVHDVLGALLVGAALHELQFSSRYAYSLQYRGNCEPIERDPVFNQFDGRLEIVEKSMDIG